MVADCSSGRMTVYNEDIMKFDVPAAFPKTEGVEWQLDCKCMDSIEATK